MNRSKSKKRSSKSKSNKPKSNKTKLACRQALSRKIKINMGEYKQGRFSSRKQAIAVSYSQIRKRKPQCKKYF
jgi:hypothetical protein